MQIGLKLTSYPFSKHFYILFAGNKTRDLQVLRLPIVAKQSRQVNRSCILYRFF